MKENEVSWVIYNDELINDSKEFCKKVLKGISSYLKLLLIAIVGSNFHSHHSRYFQHCFLCQ